MFFFLNILYVSPPLSLSRCDLILLYVFVAQKWRKQNRGVKKKTRKEKWKVANLYQSCLVVIKSCGHKNESSYSGGGHLNHIQSRVLHFSFMDIMLFLLLLLLLLLTQCDAEKLDDPKSQSFEKSKSNDSIFDGNSAMGNKAFLKTKLLENLNNFFPSSDVNEQLEILSGTPGFQQDTQNDVFSNSVVDNPFPTLLPNDPMIELEAATAPSTKIRSEGRASSEKSSLDSIRDWRQRLYKAFKNRTKIKKSALPEPNEPDVIEMSADQIPLVVDKNRQILASRKAEPNWQFGSKSIQTYGRDQNGKLIPLFGLDPSFLASVQKPIEPYEPRDIRLTYRSSRTGEPVVYIPAATRVGQQTIPVPVASYLVTANPQPVELHVMPNYNTPAPPQQVQLIFPPAAPVTTPPFEENYDRMNNNCQSCAASQNDEKCNSERLRTIILNNIVANDAESSKKAVQSAAEAETGLFFDAICGTGFFSYIAHTNEFCLASSSGVNCYLFSPVCSNQDDFSYRKKNFVNRNRV